MFSDDIVFLIENVAKMTARTVLLDPELRKKTVFVLFTSWGFPGCFLQEGRSSAERTRSLGNSDI
jgi:hypothetical protein